jgi:hypothetical protein
VFVANLLTRRHEHTGSDPLNRRVSVIVDVRVASRHLSAELAIQTL